MSLSSNTIIHFTNTKSNLIGILKDNFKLKYCRETIETKKKKADLLIPMVSFCDIPFSQILKHIDNYGSYGIGLKKEWAERNGLNPVLYVDKNSSLSDNFFEHIYKLNSTGDKNINELEIEEKYIYDIFRYLKNYEGDLKRFQKKPIKDYRFSDEREWRFVLNIESKALMLGAIPTTHSKNDNTIKEIKNVLNEEIENEKLSFDPDDINYIIVKNESERDSIIKALESVKGKFPLDQVKRLTSRILSVEQIRNDF
ncbi:MAG: abortive infection system antitoxin AbiGi family protein [Bacteroidota bacterium]